MRKVAISFLALCAALVASWQFSAIDLPHFKQAHAQVPTTGAGGAAPSSGAWTPASLPGLVLWLSASHGVSTSGSNLTGWADQSGNGYNCSNVSGTAPTYSATGFNSSYPGVTFTAANNTACWTSAIDVASTSTLSIFGLGSVPSSSSASHGRLAAFYTNTAGFDYGTPSVEMDSGSSPGSLNAYSSGNIGNGGSPPSFSLSTPYAFGIILDGTNGHIYLNNVEQTPATSFTASLLGGTNCFAIGLQQQSCGTLSSGAADATIAEEVITNNAISSANRTLLETYFVSKGL